MPCMPPPSRSGRSGCCCSIPCRITWNSSLTIRPEGLSTGVLPGRGEVLLDFQQCALIVRAASGGHATLPLDGQSQAALLDTLLATMQEQGQGVVTPGAGAMPYTEALFTALTARGHVFTPARSDLAGEATLHADPGLSAGYGRALHRIFTATARFRAGLNGAMTPVVVWPEHFDLSFLWFATAQATDSFPHINFGFAPFSSGIERPYLYAYAYPMPAGFEQLPLPAHARWHTEGWNGMVVGYDELTQADDPEALLEDTFRAFHALLAPMLTAAAQ